MEKFGFFQKKAKITSTDSVCDLATNFEYSRNRRAVFFLMRIVAKLSIIEKIFKFLPQNINVLLGWVPSRFASKKITLIN
ncbi:hypothetical protein GFO_1234 [Christiangramia forsetii KT0803]|uniref:Uncharacterized protein n=1 Tax=Christiangramia forsetii (strain DSM 17595 / CGMCC 1.15422 / KT0803) TaxID=411154 RepID=A0M0R3_CHRFK|nr:hypothetical protein GFO_1234 [Christiangramia forsetii KT0803]